MEKDELKGRLSCVKNEMTHLWGSTFLVAGGGFSLIYNSNSLKGFICGIIGVCVAVVFFRAYMIRRDETVKIVEQLRRIK